MKKVLTILILLIATTSSYGQKISIGSEVGIISSINTDYNITDFPNRRNTYYSGVNLNYNYNNKLSFTIGFHYLRQGYRHSTCYTFEEGVKNELVSKIDYLTIPITVNIHFLKSRKLITTFGLLGAYNIKAVQDYPKRIGGCYIYYIPDLTDFTRKYSISWTMGLGYKIFEDENVELISSIKYYQGITNTFNYPHNDISLNFDKKYSSAVMTIKFNYKF